MRRHLPPRRHPPSLHVAAALSLGRLFLHRPPLFLSSLPPPPAIPVISLPSLAARTKSRRCSPAAPAFCSQPSPPATTTATLISSSKKLQPLPSPLLPAAFPPAVVAALLQHRCCSPPLYRPPTTRRTQCPLPCCTNALPSSHPPLQHTAAFPCLLRYFHYHRPDLNNAQPASMLLPPLPYFHPSAPPVATLPSRTLQQSLPSTRNTLTSYNNKNKAATSLPHDFFFLPQNSAPFLPISSAAILHLRTNIRNLSSSLVPQPQPEFEDYRSTLLRNGDQLIGSKI
ncbi:hypothetical protein BHE74_00032197 [Ensete ventricosum]|nr:hypothetical protein BHE74_00032197 [Ensete ventricosum]